MGDDLNRRQAWNYLVLIFLSASSFPIVEGWSAASFHRNAHHGRSLQPMSKPHVNVRKQRTAAFQIFSAASHDASVNKSYEGGNQTISFDNISDDLSSSDELSNDTVSTGALDSDDDVDTPRRQGYDLGLGKNKPVGEAAATPREEVDNHLGDDVDAKLHWYAPEFIKKPRTYTYGTEDKKTSSYSPLDKKDRKPRRTRRMVARREEDQVLRGALWHEDHFSKNLKEKDDSIPNEQKAEEVKPTEEDSNSNTSEEEENGIRRPALFYPDIDLSIPESIYSNSTDVVWDLMRWEAYQEAQREPLLVSFLYSSILNHDSLESSLAFLLANKISSPAMISTQIQSLVKEALALDPSIGRAIRADIMAVRDRDPACTCLPDVFLYFKGFQALQTYRVANILWSKKSKTVLAHYLQSQMSQTFQIDIHPNATLGSGIMLDHGTGIVIGETARVGHNCSILHHVTLGGSGKKGVDRHPKIGEGVLLGAGASVIGNVNIGDGCQIGAGTLVISDLPAHSVAVGVPAKIIGSFVDVTEQPSSVMNQMMDTGFTANPFQSEGI